MAHPQHNESPSRSRLSRQLIIAGMVTAILIVGGMVAVRQYYYANLKPASSNSRTQSVIIPKGATADDIATILKEKDLIRNKRVFMWYVKTKEVRDSMQAGTYELSPSQGVEEIVSILTHGKIAANLVTILPGQRIDQVRKALIEAGFDEAAVDAALNANVYSSNPALVDKPATITSLEGYLYPNSFQKTNETTPQSIIEQSLQEMEENLTPEIRAAFASHGLSVYQGIILASMVEQEASKQEDRDQVAQVFLSRLNQNMRLGSDVTAFYGAIINSRPPTTGYPSPYNTLQQTGLPPTPISNVSASSLKAVAHPATTDWLYFVAGDDGTVHFSHTFEEHQSLIDQYCHTLCGE